MKDKNKQPQKIAEFVTYSLTSTFIEIILKHKQDVNFKVRNENTMAISDFLKQDKTGEQHINLLQATNLYELFFASVPLIIENNVEEQWELIFYNFVKYDDMLQTKWPAGTTMDNFLLHLPFFNDDGTPEAITMAEYFDKILTGHIRLEDLIDGLTYTVTSTGIQHNDNENQSKHTPTRAVTARASTPKSEKLTIIYSEDDYTETKELLLYNIKAANFEVRLEKDASMVKIRDCLSDIEKYTNELLEKLETAFEKKKKADEKKQPSQSL